MNNPLKQKEIKSLVFSQKLNFCGILEAKVRKENINDVCSRCFPNSWNWLENSGNLSTARIVLGWDPNVLGIHLLSSSDQLLCVQVTCLDTQRICYISAVYGANSLLDRRVLWASMRSLSSFIGDSPWLQLGDFNVVCRSSERLGNFDVTVAAEFRQCLFDINMEELTTRGAWFTWTNRRGGAGANMSRLDRVVVNAGWLDAFPESEALVHAPGISDHCSLLVCVLHMVPCKKPFRFFNYWMKHHSFKELVGQSWNQPTTGSAMLKLSLKLRRLKPFLQELNTQCFSNISRRVIAARRHLEYVQSLCSQNLGDDSLQI